MHTLVFFLSFLACPIAFPGFYSFGPGVLGVAMLLLLSITSALRLVKSPKIRPNSPRCPGD